MNRAAVLMLVVLLASCAHHDLKPPCSHPAALFAVGGCGPLRQVQ